MIHGNITGIRDSMLEELEKLYDAEERGSASDMHVIY